MVCSPLDRSELNSSARDSLPHPLILDGLSPTSRPRRVVETGSSRRRRLSVGNTVLARSIQFSKNRVIRPIGRLRITLNIPDGRARPRQLFRRQGNLSILLTGFRAVKPPAPVFRAASTAADAASLPMITRAKAVGGPELRWLRQQVTPPAVARSTQYRRPSGPCQPQLVFVLDSAYRGRAAGS